MVNEWRTDEPPKTGTFLADVGLPWPVVTVWNGAMGQYVYADLQCGLYMGKYNDTNFQNEWVDTIKRWAPMPALPAKHTEQTL